MIPEVPLVGTGMEEKVARDSGVVVLARESGTVTKVDGREIVIGKNSYSLKNFQRSNANTCVHQRPLVKLGQKVEEGQTIADGIGTQTAAWPWAAMPWWHSCPGAAIISKTPF